MSPTPLTFERVRITRVGVGYLLVTVLVAIAAVNTGNNALFLIEGGLLSLLVISGVASRRNLRRLDVRLGKAVEVHARQPFSISLDIENRDRWLARRFLEITGPDSVEPLVIPYIGRGRVRRDRLHFHFERRGIHHIPALRVSSIFPLGLFLKAMRAHADLEVLVYPPILPLDDPFRMALGQAGEETAPRKGWGHDLYALRSFRPGDDPRGIHWKRTARTGELVYMEREAEEGRRLSILLDNAVGPLEDRESEERFEHLVSEAASAAVDFLENGFEVALTTRSGNVRFGRGAAHRRRLLETLALLPVLDFDPTPLAAGDEADRELRLAVGSPQAVAG